MDKDKKVPHYQVLMNGDKGCIWQNLIDAMEDIEIELENSFCGELEEQETELYGIKIVMMSENEFNQLPEWDGW